MDQYSDISSPHPAPLMFWAAREVLHALAAPWHVAQACHSALLQTAFCSIFFLVQKVAAADSG